MKPWLALSLLLMSASAAAAAEPFSIRCEPGEPRQAYHATFDPDRKLVVFESAWPTNLYSGEIVGTEDDWVGVSFKVVQGQLNFLWNARHSLVRWPGISDDPFRPMLTHKCRAIAARSILSFREPVEAANPVSIQCDVQPPGMFFTFDTAMAKAIYQRKGGMTRDGKIEKVEADRVSFRLSTDERRLLVWDRQKNTVTVEAVADDPARPETVYQCEPAKPQTMLEYHSRLN
jgi:hypothetical protein